MGFAWWLGETQKTHFHDDMGNRRQGIGRRAYRDLFAGVRLVDNVIPRPSRQRRGPTMLIHVIPAIPVCCGMGATRPQDIGTDR